MNSITITTLAILLVLLSLVEGTLSSGNVEDLCVNATTGEGIQVNPDVEFEPLPEPFDGCDQGFCLCKIVGGNADDHMCPWDLDDFPTEEEQVYFDQQITSSVTFDYNTTCDVDTGAVCQNGTTCQGDTTGLGSTGAGTIAAPTYTNCGLFIFFQPNNGDNFYSKGSDIVDCPRSWADVEDVENRNDESGAADQCIIDALKALFCVTLTVVASIC